MWFGRKLNLKRFLGESKERFGFDRAQEILNLRRVFLLEQHGSTATSPTIRFTAYSLDKLAHGHRYSERVVARPSTGKRVSPR